MVLLETFCLWATVLCWAVMSFLIAKPSALVILFDLCSWKNIYGGHKWHSILKYNYCTACADIVHTSKLWICKMYSGRPVVDNIHLTNQSHEWWPCMALRVSNGCINIQYSKEDIQATMQESSKPGKLYCVTVFCAVIWISAVPFSSWYFIVEQ